ncbi:MAG: PliI family lysozyme inhibitor of I-type lysozyme [Arenimonas sp.]|jgi:predicted small lipoprotein YifL|uniref:PliI family lysozyme inhibitor of I-type lysozyme n=1 Tax=Arenimonas sp. TaxID=1872635 RepID=UPI003C041795
MTKSVLAAAILLSLAACGEKPADTAPAADTPAAAPAEAAAAPEAAKPGFKKEFELNGIRFVVEATNEGSMNNLTITPSGLSEANDVISREIDGSVTNAEIGDINADGSPEIYVWVNSAGSGSYATPIGYASNNNKSMSEIYFPPISEDAVNSKGYMGHDEFAVVEGVVAQRFPIYKDGDTNAQPSGKMRQLQYKLTPGEAGWVMKVDRVEEF